MRRKGSRWMAMLLAAAMITNSSGVMTLAEAVPEITTEAEADVLVAAESEEAAEQTVASTAEAATVETAAPEVTEAAPAAEAAPVVEAAAVATIETAAPVEETAPAAAETAIPETVEPAADTTAVEEADTAAEITEPESVQETAAETAAEVEEVNGAEETEISEEASETAEVSTEKADEFASETETDSESISEEETESISEEAGESVYEEETEELTEEGLESVFEEETEEETEQLYADPQTYSYNDSKVTIKVTVPEGVKIPYGSELSVRSIPNGSQMYNSLVSAVEAENSDKEFVKHYVYDICFLSDGEEIEPEDGSVTVTMEFKAATLRTSEDTPLEELIVSHIDESQAVETVASQPVDENSNKVEVSFETDSFSPFVGSYTTADPGTETDDTYLSIGASYSLGFILNHYNVFVKNNFTGTHVVGPMIVGGTATASGLGGASAEQPEYEHDVPSYFGKTANNWDGGRIGTITTYNEELPVYYGTGAKAENVWDYTQSAGSGKTYNKYYYTDKFVDFDEAMSAIEAEAKAFNGSSATVQEGVITLTAGSNYSLTAEQLAEAKAINIVGDFESDKDTIISISDNGTVTIPKIMANGEDTGNDEADRTASIVFMLPEANTVTYGEQNRATFSFVGHLVAPNAAVQIWSGNFNGCVIADSLETSAEGHMWTYNGKALTPDVKSLQVYKTLEGKEAWGDEDQFTFMLTASDGAPLPQKNGEDITSVVATKDTQNPSFGTITFTEKGTYSYTITEEEGTDQQITYSKKVYTVTYTVTVDTSSDGTETVHANRTIVDENGQSQSRVNFTNIYQEPEEPQEEEKGSLSISKEVVGTDASDKEFTFVITLKDGSEAYSGSFAGAVGDGDAEQTVVFDGDGQAAVKLTADQTLVIRDLPAGLNYTVEETDIPDGYQNTGKSGDSETIPADGTAEAKFVNTYSAGDAVVTLCASKQLRNRVLEDGEFTFKMIEVDVDGNPKSDGEKQVEVTNAGNGSVTFEQITYTLEDLGKAEDGTQNTKATKYYQISEVTDDAESGVAYDKAVYTAEVTLIDNGDGTITSNVVYKDAAGNNLETGKLPTFINTVVQVSKMNRDNAAELAGAKLEVYELIDGSKGKRIDSWTSVEGDAAKHQVVGVEQGHSYLVVEAEAPKGFVQAASTEFTIGTDGSITVDEKYKDTLEIGQDGCLLLYNSEEKEIETETEKQTETETETEKQTETETETETEKQTETETDTEKQTETETETEKQTETETETEKQTETETETEKQTETETETEKQTETETETEKQTETETETEKQTETETETEKQTETETDTEKQTETETETEKQTETETEKQTETETDTEKQTETETETEKQTETETETEKQTETETETEKQTETETETEKQTETETEKQTETETETEKQTETETETEKQTETETETEKQTETETETEKQTETETETEKQTETETETERQTETETETETEYQTETETETETDDRKGHSAANDRDDDGDTNSSDDDHDRNGTGRTTEKSTEKQPANGSVKTGDQTPIGMTMFTAITALMLAVLLLKRRREDAADKA